MHIFWTCCQDGSDSLLRKDKKDHCLHEMALHKTIVKQEASVQAISYSSINGDTHAYGSQYNRYGYTKPRIFNILVWSRLSKTEFCYIFNFQLPLITFSSLQI